jgi:hypothetical protein
MMIKVLARNNNKSGNQQLIEFLDKNLEQLNSNGISFEFRVVAESEIDVLVKRNIKQLPAIVTKNGNFFGAVQIKSYLSKFLNNKLNHSKSTSKTYLLDDPNEWMKKEMTLDAKKEDEENESEKNNVMNTYQKAMRQRDSQMKQIGGKNANNISFSSTFQPSQSFQPSFKDSNKSSGNFEEIRQSCQKGNQDDLLLSRMFEETDI